jgi:hypothetical protein
VIKQKKVNGYLQQYSGQLPAKAHLTGIAGYCAFHLPQKVAPHRRTNVP